MASESGGRGPNPTIFAVKSYALAPSKPPVCEAGGATSAAETCGGGGGEDGAALALAPLTATPGVSFERAASCPQATHQKATSAARHIRIGLRISCMLRRPLACQGTRPFAPDHKV